MAFEDFFFFLTLNIISFSQNLEQTKYKNNLNRIQSQQKLKYSNEKWVKDKTPLRTKPPSGQNPPLAKTPLRPKPLQQKPPSGQNPSPTKIPLRPKNTADKKFPPGEPVTLHNVITKNDRLLLLLKQNVIVYLCCASA